MRFKVEHETVYRYSRPVALEPHVLRLRPREDGTQRLLSYLLVVEPEPAAQSIWLDQEGNSAQQVWEIGRAHV